MISVQVGGGTKASTHLGERAPVYSYIIWVINGPKLKDTCRLFSNYMIGNIREVGSQVAGTALVPLETVYSHNSVGFH